MHHPPHAFPRSPWLAPAAWARLPLLAWRAWRWRKLRGGWLLRHLLGHRSFDLRRLPADKPIDVMVLFTDHFEPRSRAAPEESAAAVRSWCEAHQRIGQRHRDADGRPPQHTWFYRSEYRNDGCLQALAEAAFRGQGEVEFHLHHGHDTHESFAARLRSALSWFNRAGAMLTAEARPRRRFAYIAGNWALDNGAGDDAYSGCNTELLALRQAGCYADFTFPALGSPAQPRTSNSIYYATDDPGPKSYDRGRDVSASCPPCGDLMIFQGPSVVDWERARFEDAAVEDYTPLEPWRLGPWLKANVHVAGRPEWVFVKLHTHGMQSRHGLLSGGLDTLFAAMGEQWNRPPFRLHYVTAREAYNIVKAAEAGHCGNPDDYRDFAIPQPANRRVRCDGPWCLLSWTPERVCLRVHAAGPVRLDFAGLPLRSVAGKVCRLDAQFAGAEMTQLNIEGEGPFATQLHPSPLKHDLLYTTITR